MKKRIESLTKAQQAKFVDYVREWTEIGLSTKPADRKRAESAIWKMYEVAGLKAPKKIVWCGSPLSQALTREVLQKHGAALAGENLGDSVRDSVGDSVGASVWASVGASVRDSVGDSVWASVWDSVWDSVRDSVGASVGDSVRDSVYGQHDASWLAFYKFFQTECGLTSETERLEGLWELCKSAGWAIPHANVCFVSERHSIVLRDDRGRLHNPHGAALEYPDGFAIYAIHGVRVAPDIILNPASITVGRIEKETNAEVRRVMIDRYGPEKYLKDAGAVEVQEDDYGILLRKEIPNDEAIVMVRVVNSTAEPDGSFKNYTLRVPPTVKTAREAVAWTFVKTAEQYRPLVQT